MAYTCLRYLYLSVVQQLNKGSSIHSGVLNYRHSIANIGRRCNLAFDTVQV